MAKANCGQVVAHVKINSHKGTINNSTNIPKETIFTLYFPNL